MTSVTDETGIVVERYVMDAYGHRTVLNGTFTAVLGNVSSVSFGYGHQGGKHDAVLQQHVLFRHRVYDVQQLRWLQEDPMKYVDGVNAYQAYTSNPTTRLDPSGLMPNQANAINLDKLIKEIEALEAANPGDDGSVSILPLFGACSVAQRGGRG